MVDDYMLNKILNRIKEIRDIQKFDNTKILVDTDDIIFKNVVLLMTCVIKDYGKFYPQLFLEEAMFSWLNTVITRDGKVTLESSDV